MYKKTIKSFILIIVFSSFLILSSCFCYKNSISINIQVEPVTLDPRRACLLRDINLIRTFNEGLFRIDLSGKNTKAIADICFLSEDKKVYVITLKETYWSNGDKVTSHDFIYNWKTSLDKDNPSPNASLFFAIKNAEAVKNGFLSSDMLGVHPIDDSSFIIELERPTPYFLELLSLPNFFPIHKSFDTSDLIWNNNNADYVCNGPFKIDSWEKNKKITAKKNPFYWDKESVKTNQLEMFMVKPQVAFALFKNHQLDWIGSPYSYIPMNKLSLHTKNKLLNKKCLNATYLIRLNTDVFPVNNKNFRNSLALGIHRKDIVDYVLDFTAEIATGFIPPSMLKNKAPYIKDGNVLKAQELLAQSLVELKIAKDNLPRLTLIYPQKERKHKIALAVQDSIYKTLNIEIELEPVELKEYIKRIHNQDYQLALGGWSAEYRDPTSFLDAFKTKDNGTNNTGWESKDYIQALESANQCLDCNCRMESLIKAEKILLDEMPFIPLYHSSMLNLSSESLEGVILLETGAIDFKWAHIKK